MANPVREFFVSRPEAARVVLVDTSGDIYNATGGSGGGDVNIDSVGGVPIGATVPVSGTVSVTEPVSVDDNGGSLTVDGPLTDTELRATPVPVSISGSISVTEPVTVDATDLDIRNLVFATDKVDVSGSTGVGVTGPLTDTELRATPVPISGTVSVNEPVTVDATNLDIRDLVAATDSVSIHGDVGVVDQLDLTNTNPLAVAIVDGSGDQITSFGGGTQYNQGTTTTDTDTLTMAGAVRRDVAAVASGVVDGDRITLSTDNLGQLRTSPAENVTATGTIAANDETVAIVIPPGGASLTLAVTGTFTGSILFQGTLDGTDWFQLPCYNSELAVSGQISTNSPGLFFFPSSGLQSVRGIGSGWSSGTATLKFNNNVGASSTYVSNEVVTQTTLTGITNPIGGGTEALALRVTIANNSTGLVSVDDNGGSLTVDATDLDIRNLVFATDKVDATGTVLGAGTNNIGDVDVLTLPSIPAGNNNIGDVDVATIAAGDNTIGRVKITDGTDVALVTAAGEQNVLATAQPGVDIGDVTINNAAGASAVNIQDGGNTITVDGTVSVNLNAGTNTNEVVGDVAADAPAAGNPVLIAASSETMADSAPANRVSQDADATRISATDGAIFVIPTGPQTWTYHEDSSSALTDAAVHAAPAAGLSIYVTDIVFSSGAATAINIFFEEGSTKVLGPWYLEAVAGRGLAVHFGTPKKITAATALTVTTSAAIAHGLDVLGFIAPG